MHGSASKLVNLLLFLVLAGVLSPGCSSSRRDNENNGAQGNFLTVRLDSRGPYLILATSEASQDYKTAISRMRELHAGADFAVFSPADPGSLRAIIAKRRPYYVLLFMGPEEMDVNVVWKFLGMAAGLDDDPFVDIRYGFITGETPAAVDAFVERIRSALEGRSSLPRAVIDDLGPNMMAGNASFTRQKGSFFIPVYGDGFKLTTVTHGKNGFTRKRLDSIGDGGIIHFGGHGYPDRIVDGPDASLAAHLKLSPSVIFNGACYTGVTGRWFEMFTSGGRVREHVVEREKSFCLAIMGNNALAYLAAFHPDHGLPVYQEMEYLAWTGEPLGSVMKQTYDGVVLGAGGQLPALETFRNGMVFPRWTPSEVMLKGTASRVLFGDPSLIITEPFTERPYEIVCREVDASTLEVSAQLKNLKLKSTYTDTYHSDMSEVQNLFNDRALLVFDLPPGWNALSKVEVMKVTAGSKKIRHRLVAFALERDREVCRLHIQVDVPTRGYMKSDFRVSGTSLKLRVSR